MNHVKPPIPPPLYTNSGCCYEISHLIPVPPTIYTKCVHYNHCLAVSKMENLSRLQLLPFSY